MATILMVAIAILLAALVLLMVFVPQFNMSVFSSTPSFLEIKSIRHESESGAMNYDSRVTLYHNGTLSYKNADLYAVFYCNQEKLPCVIETLNGFNFIPTHHFGVQTLAGLGCSGMFWNPCEKIAIDFTDGTFHPGDLVTVEIYQRPKSLLISRHSRTA
ncbi:MAG: type IV pilin [Methanolinea sp.]|jgi:hypothetical protein|nr:type IV pilin [Methanolinea sp.]